MKNSQQGSVLGLVVFIIAIIVIAGYLYNRSQNSNLLDSEGNPVGESRSTVDTIENNQAEIQILLNETQ